MQFPLRVAYGAVAQLARAASRVAPSGDSKVLRALSGRRGIRQRYIAWGATQRDAERQLLWMHAPSVGEGLQARPVLQIARARRPDLQLAYTHFSPSATAFARSLDVDFRDYLVFDTPGDTAIALDALRPTALVFSKLDVWPTLVREAAQRGVRLGLVSATMSVSSTRRSGLGRALSAEAMRRLDAVGAVDASDADRLVASGVRPGIIEITGDTRYDQVWQRASAANLAGPLLGPLNGGRPTLVAGSTWPADEAVLLPAIGHLRRANPELRLIIAPHEPSAAHTADIVKWASESGARAATIDSAAASDADVVIVDRMGILGDLYALATIAFVGGGFHAAGLHSVLEPAAFGVPVLFGPRHERSRDANLLESHEGGVTVETADEIEIRVASWLADDTARRAAGSDARGLVRGGLGAAERSFELVQRLLR